LAVSVLTPDHRLSPPCASRTKSSRSFMFGSFSAAGAAAGRCGLA
jgi:hypothetical protein